MGHMSFGPCQRQRQQNALLAHNDCITLAAGHASLKGSGLAPLLCQAFTLFKFTL